ncbi:beta-ketoacyl-[acyl-carrier-protein] synthase family protein [Ectothiorhodospiraceae bacterium WFHF3C12]|nr:beta-ketoacyl-[acyl-carrier-protein] synthase family protein [Ectothiorhodospiraceae bacterium WFHF3C12]
MTPLVLTRCTAVNALGCGMEATREALAAQRSGLRPNDFHPVEVEAYIGRVDGLETFPVAEGLADYDCRNNRLAELCLQQDDFESAVVSLRERYAPERIGVFLGTSTSGILETELAYAHLDAFDGRLPDDFHYRERHNFYSVADYVRRRLGLTGPAEVISTACSSSAKVFATAHRFIQAGFCDAALVGGVDSLCLTTLYGFNALELVSPEPCRPADANRRGLSLGEAAGLAILETPDRAREGDVVLLGYGESSDAHHMSTPHPEGRGAAQAMSAALGRAGIEPPAVDYINLHGTATPINDRTEDIAVAGVFGTEVPCSSTKGWTGHTLGAAGITEALITALCLQDGLIPASLNTREVDPEFRSHVVTDNELAALRVVASNSFGFGGSNCCLIFGRRM